VKATDPSEAIRSNEVLSAAGTEFEILCQVDCGGSVLQPLLYELVPNFSNSNHDHRAMLELMVLLEENLVDARVLDSDFVFALARRRSDSALMFDLPPMAGGSCNTGAVSRMLPWCLRSLIPETGGLVSVAEHLAERITGRPDCDPLDWIVRQSCPGIVRSPKRSRVRLLGGREFETHFRSRFRDVTVGWPTGGTDDTSDVVLSIGGISYSEIATGSTVERLAATVRLGGALVLLVPCRDLGHLPVEATRSRVRAVARVLPPRFDLSPFFEIISDDIATSRRPEPTVIRESLKRHFEIRHWIPLGWAILNVLIPVIAHQIDEEDESDATLMRLLCLLDQKLVDSDVLPAEFLLVIARRNRNPA
jgi:hypothetical protein